MNISGLKLYFSGTMLNQILFVPAILLFVYLPVHLVSHCVYIRKRLVDKQHFELSTLQIQRVSSLLAFNHTYSVSMCCVGINRCLETYLINISQKFQAQKMRMRIVLHSGC
jgi:hypothetical protein